MAKRDVKITANDDNLEQGCRGLFEKLCDKKLGDWPKSARIGAVFRYEGLEVVMGWACS